MRVPVELFDYATKEPVEGELFDEVTVEHFLETQRDWRPAVIEAAKAMLKSGAPRENVPRHFHWDWSTKEADLRVLAFSFFGITCRGKLQGIMKLETAGRSSRLPEHKGKPLIYIDYLETAPWNIKTLVEALGKGPQFGAVGTRLIEALCDNMTETSCVTAISEQGGKETQYGNDERFCSARYGCDGSI